MLYYTSKYTNLRTQTLANKACKISGINFRKYKNSESYHINFQICDSVDNILKKYLRRDFSFFARLLEPTIIFQPTQSFLVQFH